MLKPVQLLFLAVAVTFAQPASRNTDSTLAKFYNVDRQFSKMSSDVGPYRAFTNYFTADAYILPASGRAESGKEAIRKSYGDFPKNAKLTWEPTGGQCSRGGSLGYTSGDYRIETREPSGRVRLRSGRYVSVWKRQADGSLRVVADMGNPERIVLRKGEFITRQVLRREHVYDLRIIVGTFTISRKKGKKVLFVRNGNYITVRRIYLGGRERVVAEFMN